MYENIKYWNFFNVYLHMIADNAINNSVRISPLRVLLVISEQ